MTSTTRITIVQGAAEAEQKYIVHTRRVWFFFTTAWHEIVSEKHLGNDIRIETLRPIRNVFLNGELISSNPTPPELKDNQ